MHLTPTAEQQEIKESVRRFCQEQITPVRQRDPQERVSGTDAGLWRHVSDLGWFGLGLPAAAGGSGLGLVEVACLFEECARGLVPQAVLCAIRGGLALARLDQGNEHLGAIARGERTVALAFEEQHARSPAAYRTRVVAERGAIWLAGEKWYVRGGREADLHIVAAVEGAGVSLVLVPNPHTQCAPLRTFDADPQAVVRYERVPVLLRLSAAAEGAVLMHALQEQQVALALAEMVGGMDAVLAMTVAYVKEREQFGQKIAVFQAVQHQVADMATVFTAARHLAWQAITRLAAGSVQDVEVPLAAAFVGQAFKRVTLTAMHLHGGAGYVLEHPLHQHAERAQSLCIRYAPEVHALAEVAAALLDK